MTCQALTLPRNMAKEGFTCDSIFLDYDSMYLIEPSLQLVAGFLLIGA